jgi:glutamate-5-semialdehyde dehydrogenase
MDENLAALHSQGAKAKEAAHKLSFLPTDVKNGALLAISRGLLEKTADILAANKLDYEEAKNGGMSPAMLDRLLLTGERIKAIAGDVNSVVALPDPVGEIFDMRTMPNGLQIGKKRVPVGVIAAIYESRPNVTIDIASLCLKSGNAVILRGGKETLRSNQALIRVINEALQKCGIPSGAVQLIENPDHAIVNELLRMRDAIDLVYPGAARD